MSFAEFVNADGSSVMIGDDYFNYSLRHSQRLTFSAGGILTYDFSVTRDNCETPVIAFRTATVDTVLLSTTRSGNSVTWSFRAFSRYPAQVGTFSFEYWIFDRPNEPANDFTLILYDAAGNIAFDARRKYLRYLQFFDQDLNGTGPFNFTAPGNQFAVVQGQLSRVYGFDVIEGGGPGGSNQYFQVIEGKCVRVNGSSFSFMENPIYSSTPVNSNIFPAAFFYRQQMFLVDVSSMLIP